MTELRYKLRVSTLEDIPEFKPILEKINVHVHNAVANIIDAYDKKTGYTVKADYYVCNLDLYGKQKLLVSLDYTVQVDSHSVSILSTL
jgi:hypothetical protein